MFKNYFKTTFRNLWKNKTYSFLNIFGLAVGIACAALIFLWVEDELTYNHYFSNRDNLYNVKDQQTYDGTTFTFDATPGPMAQSIKAEIPGIKIQHAVHGVINCFFLCRINQFMKPAIMLIQDFYPCFNCSL
jgi:hypothetical protein